jgi:aldose 1-epimerase
MELTLSGHRVIENVVAGREDLYSGVVMAPWSSRIEAGKWTLPNGEEVEVPINEPDRNNALHGLVYNQSFSVKRSTASSVELVIEIAPTASYPFSLRLGVSYEIEDGELYSSFAVKNLSATKAPFGIGFHPYLSTEFAGQDVTIRCEAETMFELNQNMIATGKIPASKSPKDLNAGRVVSGAGLDDGFTDLKFEQGIASTFLEGPSGLGLQVWQEDIFKHTVIYTPETFPTAQGSITAVAIEPSTSEVNAFNSKQDLLMLSPGETRSGSWGIRLT